MTGSVKERRGDRYLFFSVSVWNPCLAMIFTDDIYERESVFSESANKRAGGRLNEFDRDEDMKAIFDLSVGISPMSFASS